MNNTGSVQGSVTDKEAKEQLKLQLAQYVEQQPASKQAFHRWMKGLEVASLVIVAAVFILAMYVSINWTNVPTQAIHTAWFAFVESFTLTIVLVGLHAAILRAFPPIVGPQAAMVRASSPIKVPGKQSKFVTGRKAVGQGWGLVVLGVVVGAFWGLIAYATWTVNWAMLKPLISILAIVFCVGLVFSLIYTTIQKISKSR
jgi:hypothetical protein